MIADDSALLINEGEPVADAILSGGLNDVDIVKQFMKAGAW